MGDFFKKINTKLKNRGTTWSSSPTPGIYPEKMKTLIQKVHTPQCSEQHVSQKPRQGSNLEDTVHIDNGILLSHKKEWDKCHLQQATWMDLEIIIPSEANQRKIRIIWYHLYVESKKIVQINLFTNQKQTHRHKQKYDYQRRRGRRGKSGAWH